MKKIIAVMCAGILCLSLAACGNNNAGSDAPQEQTQAQSSENTSEEASAQVDDTQSKSTEGDSEMRVARDGADMQTDDKAMPTRLPMEGGTKINMYFGDTLIPGVLNDSETAKALIEKLPITQHVSRYSHDFCGVTETLPYKEEEVHYGWLNGDIDYATDAPYFTILFEDEDVSEQYGNQVNIGVITCPLEEIAALEGDYDVRIELAEEGAAASADKSSQEENISVSEKAKNNSLAVYFSRVGNTDFPEDVDASSSASIQEEGGQKKGNAQMIAEWISEEAGCETFEILTKESYPVDYDETVDQASNEQNEGARPELKTEIENLDEYDTIYLVFPNWWGDMPMPVYSFLDAYDLSGKKINVFITHEGSSFSGTIDTIKELEPEAEVTEGLAVRGGSVAEEEDNIRQWVKDK